MSTTIHDLFGLSPSSEPLQNFIEGISPPSKPLPTVKVYPDIVYYNYFAVGLSLQFIPTNGYKPRSGDSLDQTRLSLDAFDFYNVPQLDASDPKTKGTSARRAELAFSTYPRSLTLHITPGAKDKDGKALTRPSQLEVSSDTTGKTFVEALGEPDRKGGGVGPSSGSIGIWCEWSSDGVLVEFGGDEANGPQAWERGKDAIWKVITVFNTKRESQAS